MTNVDNAPGAGSYASVNGLEMYYEIHGTGRPHIELERTRVIETPSITHLRFRGVKED